MRPKISALFTDFYQLTMAHGFFTLGKHDQEACYQMFFRKGPFGERGALISGIADVVHYLENFAFTEEDLSFLSEQTSTSGKPLFSKKFITFLKNEPLRLTVDAVAEGSYVFAKEPIIRVTGPIWQCQIVESAILNLVNFSTLISTKAMRVCLAAGEDPVVDFGMRRAHGVDGALTASRAAFIGGVQATSNVEAGKLYGIPVKGTVAHSWIMAFPTEEEAFTAYASVYPDDCQLLIDTYETMQGLKTAIQTAKLLHKNSKTLKGVRLDSGDLSTLSFQVREMLDENGLQDVKIFASNELEEEKIQQLKACRAPITGWGVGTKLTTGSPDCALGGVYKLCALKEASYGWVEKRKISNDPIKTTLAGAWEIERLWREGQWLGDLLASDNYPGSSWVDLHEPTKPFLLDSSLAEKEKLLQPLFTNGKKVFSARSLQEIQEYAKTQVLLVRNCAQECRQVVGVPKEAI